MKSTYRAMQVVRPGILEPVEREVPEPRAGEALIEVEAYQRMKSGKARFRMVLTMAR